jgi:hypothetical protein
MTMANLYDIYEYCRRHDTSSKDLTSLQQKELLRAANEHFEGMPITFQGFVRDVSEKSISAYVDVLDKLVGHYEPTCEDGSGQHSNWDLRVDAVMIIETTSLIDLASRLNKEAPMEFEGIISYITYRMRNTWSYKEVRSVPDCYIDMRISLTAMRSIPGGIQNPLGGSVRNLKEKKAQGCLVNAICALTSLAALVLLFTM